MKVGAIAAAFPTVRFSLGFAIVNIAFGNSV